MSAQKYHGSCHCGAVAFDVTLDLDHAITCNCSMCNRAGSVLAFAPESAFTLLSGEDKLTNYQFNKKVIDHLFCSVCGIKAFGRGVSPDGTKTVAVNARCLDRVDVTALKPMHYDGASM